MQLNFSVSKPQLFCCCKGDWDYDENNPTYIVNLAGALREASRINW